MPLNEFDTRLIENDAFESVVENDKIINEKKPRHFGVLMDLSDEATDCIYHFCTHKDNISKELNNHVYTIPFDDFLTEYQKDKEDTKVKLYIKATLPFDNINLWERKSNFIPKKHHDSLRSKYYKHKTCINNCK